MQWHPTIHSSEVQYPALVVWSTIIPTGCNRLGLGEGEGEVRVNNGERLSHCNQSFSSQSSSPR